MFLPKEIISLVEATVRDYSEMKDSTKALIAEGKKRWLHHEVYRRSLLARDYSKADFSNLSKDEEEHFFMLFEKAIPDLKRRDYIALFALLGTDSSYLENAGFYEKRPRKAALGTPIPCHFEFDMDPRDNAAYIDLYVGEAFPAELSSLDKVIRAYKYNKLDFEIEFTQFSPYADNKYELRGVIRKDGEVDYKSAIKRRGRDKTDKEHNEEVEMIIRRELTKPTLQAIKKKVNYLMNSELSTLRSSGVKIYINPPTGIGRRIRIWRNEQFNETEGYNKFIKLINLFESPKPFLKCVQRLGKKQKFTSAC